MRRTRACAHAHHGASRLASAALGSLALALGGCGSSSSPQDTVAPLADGAYQVSIEGDAPVTGEAFFSAGKGYVVLSDDGDAAASVLYSVGEFGIVRRVPPSADHHRVEFALQRPLALDAASVAGLASSYQTWLANQKVAFSVSANGTISAGNTPCKLSGNLAAVPGSASLSVTLIAAGCASVSAGRYTGLLYASDALAPAAFRIVAENGSALVDLLAYR